MTDLTALKTVSLMELFYSAGSLLEMTVWPVSMNAGGCVCESLTLTVPEIMTSDLSASCSGSGDNKN